MLIYLFQVTVCLAFFYGLYFLGLRKETMFHTNRMYLMITLIISLVLPFVKIYIDEQQADSNTLVASTVYLGNYVNNFSVSIATPVAKTIPWLKIFTGVYLLGAAVMSVRLLFAFKQILDIRKTGIHTKVSGHLCVLSDKVKSPFSFFNTIYLPLQHSFSEVELNEVIVHEKAHVSGMHTWDVILMELLCIKLWPSPMIYLYRKSMKEVHEFVADAAVLKDTHWENYAQLLVSQQHNQLQNILSNQLIYSQLKKRLLMMNKERSGFAARYKYLGIIPLLLIALILFSFREKMADSLASDNPTEVNQDAQELILLIGADHRLYFGIEEIAKEDLPLAVQEMTKGMTDPQVRVIAEDPNKTTGGEIGEILQIGNKMNMRWFLDTDEMGKYAAYKSSVLERKVNYSADTLPESSIIALRLTEPVLTPSIPEDYTKLDYTLPMPIFPGCDDVPIRDRGNCGMEKLGEYINAHMVYPESLKKSGKEGRVLVKFAVDANGYVKDVAIQQSLDPAADQAVLDLVNGMNANVGKWRPARKEGISFDAEMVLPVTFSLGTYRASPEPLKEVDEMARFPGCEQIANLDERNACAQEKMFQFVYSNIKYPKEDREQNIEGIGIVQFVIGADGRITDIDVLRSPSPGIKAELLRLINDMAALPERWVPAQKDGKPVAFQMILPVKFKLQDEQKEKEEAPALSPETNKMNALKITPNPAQESINVSYFEGAYILKIFDTSGNLVLSREIASGIAGEETISISTLKPGQYVIQVNSETKTMSSSFVKI